MPFIKGPKDEELRSILNQGHASGFLIPSLIGLQLQIFLCGVCIAVAFISPAFAANSRPVRTFLASVVALNILYTACQAMLLIATSSSQARDAAFFHTTSTLEELLALCFYLAVATSVQIFYAIRVAKILRAKPARLSWLAIFAAGLCASLVGWAGHMQRLTELYLGDRPELGGILKTHGKVIHLLASAFVDILSSATLALLLRRNMLGFSIRTDTLLQRVSRVTLSTAALTSVTASVAAIIDLTSLALSRASDNWKATLISYSLASVYCLSLVWTLDLRSRLRQEQGGRRHGGVSFGLPLSLPSASTAGSGRDRIEWLEMSYLGDPFHVRVDVGRSPKTMEQGCDTLT